MPPKLFASSTPAGDPSYDARREVVRAPRLLAQPQQEFYVCAQDTEFTSSRPHLSALDVPSGSA